jgi:predicted esterase
MDPNNPQQEEKRWQWARLRASSQPNKSATISLMLANKSILCALLVLLGPLLSIHLVVAQPAPRESGCNELQKAIAEPSKATATIRGEYLKNNKTLVQDIFLSSEEAPRIKAFLIKPYKAAPGVGGAVLFVHWLGAPPANDRTEFFEDAVQLADHNVTCLLVEAPWADPEWFPNRKLDDSEANTLRYVTQLRSYFRYLLAEAKPEADKIAFVGHDFGAMYGALLLQQENAIRHAVMMAAVPDFADWYLLGRKLSDSDARQFRERMSPIAPSRYLRCARNVDVLFQFAENDRFVSREQASAFIGSAPTEKTVLWYSGGHELQDASRKDRVAWLVKRTAPRSPGN